MTTTWDTGNCTTGTTFTNGDLTVANPDGSTRFSARATASITTGQKRYWEITYPSDTGRISLGVCNSSFPFNSGNWLGELDSGEGLLSDLGAVYCNSGQVGSADTYTTADVLGIAVDFSNGNIWFRTNGGNWNSSGTADPATNTGGIAINVTGALYPAWESDGAGGEVTANFGATSFAHAAPSGFTGFDSTSGISLALAATEATDTASFSASIKDSLSLAATEAKDTASFSAALKDVASLAATEAADTASISASLSDDSSLAATEPADTASFAASLSLDLSLDSTEAQDTADFGVDLSDDLALAATEGLDTAAFVIDGDIDAVLDATEAQDVASFVLIGDPQLLAQVYGGSALWKRKQFKRKEVEKYVTALVETVETVAPALPQPAIRKQVVQIVQQDPHTASLAEFGKKLDQLETIIERVMQERAEQDEEDAAFLLLAA